MVRWMGRICAATALCFVGALLQPALAADAPARLDNRWFDQTLAKRLFFFGGADVASDSFFTWSGIVGAPVGTMDEDGWRLRIAAGAGRYRYQTTAVTGGINAADVVSGEAMAGYRFAHGSTIATIFAGAHVENQRLHWPDPGHRAQGTQIGIKALIELYRRFTPNIVGTASASASTVHRAYHLRATLAHAYSPAFAVGAEAMLLGDRRYSEPRAGLFVQSTYGRTTWSLAGGVLSNSDKGDGGYATVAVQAAY